MNKSEELAKLLGIPGRWDDCCSSDCDCEHKIGNKCNSRSSWIDCDNGVDGYVYPDFTKPSNFVKLLHLYKYYLNNSLELNKYSRNYNEHSNINIYINQKIDKAIEIYHWAKEVLDVYNKDFIKQVQQTEWEY